ncbi:MAG: hypothetical protein LBN20_00085 [Endomicrobium sp.]|jgi:hypothetical protein|nr:hypothetical protein [Endomicrobium sp.]
MNFDELAELFNGVAIVIDDELGDPEKKANIFGIVEQINKAKIPVVCYRELPNDDEIRHFKNISFLILDWKLLPKNSATDSLPEVKEPESLKEYYEDNNINFINKLSKICFCPIFIFSNEHSNEIKQRLIAEKLYIAGKSNRISVHRKSSIIKPRKLFAVISQWLSQNPSMYVLKKWEYEYRKTINSFFNEFQEINPNWTHIMWNCFEKDNKQENDDYSLELGDLLAKNIFTRMAPFEFKKEILAKKNKTSNPDDLRKILEGGRYLSKKYLKEDDIGTGDLFKAKNEQDGKDYYWLNIRPQCDLLRKKKDDIDLYCLKGRVLEKSKIGKDFLWHEGKILEKSNHSVVEFIDNGKIIEFLFRDIKIFQWKKQRNHRIGRILPPYINHIQQRYSLYLQRQGLMRIPEKAIE